MFTEMTDRRTDPLWATKLMEEKKYSEFIVQFYAQVLSNKTFPFFLETYNTKKKYFQPTHVLYSCFTRTPPHPHTHTHKPHTFTCTQYISYLLHRIIDIFPQIFKLKIIRFKPVLLAPRSQRPELTKLAFILRFF